MKTIRDIAVHQKTVFLRVDFNVPLDDEGNITEDARIKAALTTIEYLIQKEAKIVIGSHLGRPKGKVVESMRMAPVAKRLQELLGQEVHYASDCVGEEVRLLKERMKPGDVLLLENLRFHEEEKKNDMHFAQQLADGVDVYVTEAFGVVHRKHASTHALPSLIFDKAIGFLMEEELKNLGRLIHGPDQPMVVVIGGIKISDKVDVIRKLAPMSDVVLVGGGVSNTFYAGLGNDVGKSLVESDSVSEGQDAITYTDVARDIYEQFEHETPTIDMRLPDGSPLKKIQLPLDFVAAPSIEEGAETRVLDAGEPVPEGWMYLDIGPKTAALYAEVLGKAKTIFWNGPMGLFEMDAYANGSRTVAESIAESDGYAVLGGGDTEVVTEKFGLKGRYSHASTGGGASLTYLAQNPLPGLEALD